MHIVAKIILTVAGGAALVAVLPLALFAVGTAKALNWAELHGIYSGDEAARDKARWLNS